MAKLDKRPITIQKTVVRDGKKVVQKQTVIMSVWRDMPKDGWSIVGGQEVKKVVKTPPEAKVNTDAVLTRLLSDKKVTLVELQATVRQLKYQISGYNHMEFGELKKAVLSRLDGGAEAEKLAEQKRIDEAKQKALEDAKLLAEYKERAEKAELELKKKAEDEALVLIEKAELEKAEKETKKEAKKAPKKVNKKAE